MGFKEARLPPESALPVGNRPEAGESDADWKPGFLLQFIETFMAEKLRLDGTNAGDHVGNSEPPPRRPPPMRGKRKMDPMGPATVSTGTSEGRNRTPAWGP